MKTLVLYDGPSQMPGPGFGEPIIALLTEGSGNSKTSNMPTLWVLPKDVNVWEAIRTGADASVCGDCPQRKTAPQPEDLPPPPKKGKAKRKVPLCYTYARVLRAAGGMQKAFHKGNMLDGTTFSVRQVAHYLECSARYGGAKAVRSAAYGDAAALPPAIWQKLDDARRQVGLGVRGYTHQWRWAEHLRVTHMASAHTALDLAEATAAGWRYFLSNSPEELDSFLHLETGWDLPGAHPTMCPASKEAGYLTNCTDCTACGGLTRGLTSPSRYIYDHGPGSSKGVVKTALEKKAAVVIGATPRGADAVRKAWLPESAPASGRTEEDVQEALDRR